MSRPSSLTPRTSASRLATMMRISAATSGPCSGHRLEGARAEVVGSHTSTMDRASTARISASACAGAVSPCLRGPGRPRLDDPDPLPGALVHREMLPGRAGRPDAPCRALAGDGPPRPASGRPPRRVRRRAGPEGDGQGPVDPRCSPGTSLRRMASASRGCGAGHGRRRERTRCRRRARCSAPTSRSPPRPVATSRCAGGSDRSAVPSARATSHASSAMAAKRWSRRSVRKRGRAVPSSRWAASCSVKSGWPGGARVDRGDPGRRRVEAEQLQLLGRLVGAQRAQVEHGDVRAAAYAPEPLHDRAGRRRVVRPPRADHRDARASRTGAG